MLRRRISELQVATMLLTRFPAGRIAGEVPALKDVGWAYPVVGVAIGVVGGAVHACLMWLGASGFLSGVGAILILALVTGALHFDGLADFADGVGGGKDRAHCLEIMKDSRIGAYGVVALILGVGLWAGALEVFANGAVVGLFILIAVYSRVAILAVQELLPTARSEGLGAQVAGGQWGARVSAILAVVLGLAWFGQSAVWAFCAMAVVAAGVAWVAWRRIGGQTGDVLGAVQITTEVSGWVVLSVVLQDAV